MGWWVDGSMGLLFFLGVDGCHHTLRVSAADGKGKKRVGTLGAGGKQMARLEGVSHLKSQGWNWQKRTE